MSGMDALADNVECKASGIMANVNVTSMSCKSLLTRASPTAINLEGGCPVTIGDVVQEAAVSFAMASTVQAEDLALPQFVAGSSTNNLADLSMPQFSNLGPPFEVPAMAGNTENCVKACHASGKGKGICNSTNGCLDLEDTNLTETQPSKGVQVCAICHEKIKAEETAEIKGCEHSYCVTCILRWATYKAEPWCPQCRLPFSFLYVYRALDGSLSDYLFEESVCLLLRAFWFKPLVVQEPEEQDDYQDDYDAYEEPYYTSNVRLGNRRWGDSGYVRAGRREARPVGVRQVGESGSSSSRQAKGKEPAKETVGRRARRAQKREQLDKLSGKK